jgi:hypothetical protein
MRLRFIEEKHRSRPRMQKGKQHEHLWKTAAGTRNIQAGTIGKRAVFGDYVRSACVRREDLTGK